MSWPTPWGPSQTVSQVVRGFSFVTTAGHGGVMVSKGFAKKNLSEAAIKKGINCGNYICYEEDCRFAIAYFEFVNKFPEQWEKVKFKDTNTVDELKTKLIHYISAYDADYLLAVGIKPAEPEYTDYKEWHESLKLRNEKNPNLIISATGQNNNTVIVTTADEKTHVVKSESYHPKTLNLLSNCQLV